LAGYSDRLSARPGDSIQFHLSSAKPTTTVCAKLSRCICADPNPKGPGIIEEDASKWLKGKHKVAVSHQSIPRGSYANTDAKLTVSSYIETFQSISQFSVDIWFFPTLLPHLSVLKNASPPLSPRKQNIWSWGDLFRLDVQSKGQLESSLPSGATLVGKRLKSKRYCYPSASIYQSRQTFHSGTRGW
jgi:hypothetical protein